MKLIDADALMQDIKSNAYIIRDVFNSTDEGMSVNGIQYAVEHMPTIQSAGVKGEWVASDEDVVMSKECSVCGVAQDYYSANFFNFCPHCGADMRGDNK